MVPGDASSLHPVKKKMIRMSGSNEKLIIETLHTTNIIRRYFSTLLIGSLVPGLQALDSLQYP